MSKSYLQLEKKFYSKNNYKLLEDVILEMIPKNNLTENYQNYILNIMENVFKKISKDIIKFDKNTITSLNKNVLSEVAKIKPDNKKIDFLPPPEETKIGFALQNHINPIQPEQKPSLYPNDNVDYIPRQDRFVQKNTNDMFKIIGEERKDKNSRPKEIDFRLPENTKPDFLENNFDSNDKPTYNSFLEGLDEKLFEQREINDFPIKNTNRFPPQQMNDTNRFPPQQMNDTNQFPPQQMNDTNRFPPQQINDISISDEVQKKYCYIHISSKYRNTSIYPSPTYFSSFIVTKKNKKDVKIQDTIIFTDDEIISDSQLKDKDIISIECLDVTMPKIDSIIKEPHIWLCIKEWESLNIGNGIPNNAFLRLKPVLYYKDLQFVTCRGHLLEKQTSNKLNDKITLELLKSDGEKININDKTEIKSIDNNILYVNNHSNLEGDRIYIYSMYSNEITGFYPNVFIHDLKVEKENNQSLSFRLFIDNSPNDINNKISIFSNTNDKTNIISSQYIQKDYMIYLEYVKTKNTNMKGIYKVLDVKNDIIMIEFPQTKKTFIPKIITKIGFIKKNENGYLSDRIEDINYKGGCLISKVENNKIYIDNTFKTDDYNKYFFINSKNQINYMFKVTYV